MIPCSYRASTCTVALPTYVALYVISVRQARGLPVVSLFPHPASFRFHLAMDTLAFGYTLPTTGRVWDFHPLETCAAGRTAEEAGDFAPASSRALLLISFSCPPKSAGRIQSGSRCQRWRRAGSCSPGGWAPGRRLPRPPHPGPESGPGDRGWSCRCRGSR